MLKRSDSCYKRDHLLQCNTCVRLIGRQYASRQTVLGKRAANALSGRAEVANKWQLVYTPNYVLFLEKMIKQAFQV